MNKIKASRAMSFSAVALVYLSAIAAGIALYRLCPLPFALALLVADTAATVLVFLFSLLFQNASVYDPYWSVQPPVIVTAFALGGSSPLGLLLLVPIWFWAIRLTANWAYTFRGLEHQDWRYTMLKEKTGAFYPLINFVGIHMVPTLVVYGCTLPAVYALREGLGITPGSVIFCLLAVLSATMQGIADLQMHRYRKKKGAPFIRCGLWKYSRHPNYLGEILQWWCIALAVLAAGASPFLLLGALANTLLFLLVSIPLADGRQSKKEGWEAYKRETRMLLPVYKKP